MKRARSINFTLLAASVLLIALWGCENGGGKEEVEVLGSYPAIEISPAEVCVGGKAGGSNCQVLFELGAVEVGGKLKSTLLIKNSGERPLLIKSVELVDFKVEGGGQDNTPPFSLELGPQFTEAQAGDSDFFVAALGEGTPEIAEELAVRIVFEHVDNQARSATLVLRTDASNAPVVNIAIGTVAGFPRIQVNPTWVDFAQVSAGQQEVRKVNIFNTGDADLALTGFTATGSEYYTVSVHGTDYAVGEATAAGVTFEESLVIPAGEKTYFDVRFVPISADPASAILVLFSNDPVADGGSEVTLSGNETVPCLAVNPEKLSFGGKAIGETSTVPLELLSCGDAPVHITGLHFAEGSSPDFSVATDQLGQDVTAETPLVIPIGGSFQLPIAFQPNEINPISGEGSVLLDLATLIIENNTFDAEKKVEMDGAGAGYSCPTPIIKIDEGDEVIPQTVLHLTGDESYSAQGAIVKWQWNVEGPLGSVDVFVPSYNFPNPTLTVNIAGIYKIQLTVFDELGTPSCYPAVYEVVVVPDEALHVELLWHTPEDLDETDTGPEAGADLDLHFLHPYAAGPDLDGDGAPDGWFDIPWDCFWFNAHPNWGSFAPNINDDPGLDRDDTDGGGPENINLNVPENATYRVGVHYWNEHGFGPSYATMRIYVYGQLVFEVADVKLVGCDMWDVATIEWPSGQVKMVTDPGSGGYKITPNYANPFFPSDCQ
jgi:hypothetical protein